MRDHYADVGVPVFIMSGWQDGYKNPVRAGGLGLRALGKPVAGLIGAWGHKYPFNGYPGPRVDWLNYIVTHWWDRWLKGKTPPPRDRWPQLPVWLGEVERAEQIGLRRRDRQMGGRGRRLALAGQGEDPLSAGGNRLGDAPEARDATRARASRCSTPRCSRRARGANAAMTIFPAIRRHSTRSRSISTAIPCPRISTCSARPIVTLTLSVDRPIAALAIG